LTALTVVIIFDGFVDGGGTADVDGLARRGQGRKKEATGGCCLIDHHHGYAMSEMEMEMDTL